MAYTSWSVSFGEQPSAAKWNILGTNDASFNDGTGIADGAILPEHLVASTGTGWAWQSFTPTWTGSGSNPAIGNGSIAGLYSQIGKTVIARYYVIYGSTTTYGSGNFRLSYPVTSNTIATGYDITDIGGGHYIRNGVANYDFRCMARTAATTYFEMFVTVAAGGGAATTIQNFAPTAPATSQNGDSFRCQVIYEAA